MSYKCPICLYPRFITKTSSALSTHMVGTTKSEKHVEWIESHDISYVNLVTTGNHAPLIAVIEKECKVEN